LKKALSALLSDDVSGGLASAHFTSRGGQH